MSKSISVQLQSKLIINIMKKRILQQSIQQIPTGIQGLTLMIYPKFDKSSHRYRYVIQFIKNALFLTQTKRHKKINQIHFFNRYNLYFRTEYFIINPRDGRISFRSCMIRTKIENIDQKIREDYDYLIEFLNNYFLFIAMDTSIINKSMKYNEISLRQSKRKNESLVIIKRIINKQELKNERSSQYYKMIRNFTLQVVKQNQQKLSSKKQLIQKQKKQCNKLGIQKLKKQLIINQQNRKTRQSSKIKFNIDGQQHQQQIIKKKYDQNEIQMLKKLKKKISQKFMHQNIKFIPNYYYENKKYTYIQRTSCRFLNQFLKNNQKTLSFKNSLNIFIQIIQILGEIHKCDFVFLNLTEDNILIDQQLNIKIFGFQKMKQIQTYYIQHKNKSHNYQIFTQKQINRITDIFHFWRIFIKYVHNQDILIPQDQQNNNKLTQIQKKQFFEKMIRVFFRKCYTQYKERNQSLINSMLKSSCLLFEKFLQNQKPYNDLQDQIKQILICMRNCLSNNLNIKQQIDKLKKLGLINKDYDV